MKKLASATLAVLLGVTLYGADEAKSKAPIVKAALFKNGYALVTREVRQIPPKPFLIDEEINPVHGTLWFFGASNLSVTSVERPGTRDNENPFGNFAATYQNRKVTVTLRTSDNEQPRIIKGTMLRLGKSSSAASVQPYYRGQQPESYLAVKLESGELITFSKGMVLSIESDGINDKIIEDKRMLLVQCDPSETPMSMNYLTFGLSWAPAYRIALSKDAKMRIDQSAVITNEIEDLAGAEVNLISGFPNLEYMRVTSPLMTASLNQFFQQLSGQNRYQGAATMQQMAMYNNVTLNEPTMSRGVSPLPETGASEDIHYFPAGKVSLAKGSSVYREIASAETTYERIVEWEIPDRRSQWGTYDRNYSDKENPYGELWDAIRFKNPLKAPITTAPVEIVDGEKILGQGTIKWVNPGQETLVKITKSLTVTGTLNEYEIPDKSSIDYKMSGRKIVHIAGYNYRNPEVEGTLKLHNYRSTAAVAVVKLQFSGELVSAEQAPEAKVLETGVYSVNPRRELTWELNLKPGEEVTVKYKYSVLVRM